MLGYLLIHAAAVELSSAEHEVRLQALLAKVSSLTCCMLLHGPRSAHQLQHLAWVEVALRCQPTARGVYSGINIVFIHGLAANDICCKLRDPVATLLCPSVHMPTNILRSSETC